MWPLSNMVDRFGRLDGIAETPAHWFGERSMNPLVGCPASAPTCLAEELEPRLLLSGAVPGAFDPQYIIYNAAAGNLAASGQAADAVPLGSSPLGSSSQVGLTPLQIRTAYGIGSITVGSLIGDGTGQTIAIVDAYDDPSIVSSSDPNYLNSDLHKFDAQFSLPDFGGPGQPTFQKLDQNGGTAYPSPNKSWATEIALDVEWAHAIAPKANIVLVEANSNVDPDLLPTAVNTAANLAGVSAVSMSFGDIESADDLSTNSDFLTPVGHAGVTFLAASGDDGSPGLYPAFSPNVLAVGGTTLTLNGSNYGSEAAWSGSGGGQSTSQLEPIYQEVVQNSAARRMPDVAFDANPSSGVAVYDSYGQGASTPWVQVGGTSVASPCWAGMIAIVNQIRASQGLPSLDGRSEALPGIYSLQTADFHDITSGSNGGFSAGSGYDEVTGRGSPVAPLLVAALAATNIPAPVVFYSANMDTNPGWTYQGQWAWGQPTGSPVSQGGPDPTSGHTGLDVVGYNLSGGYSRISGTLYATTPAINCSGRTGVTLDFWRWLGVEGSNHDHAYVQVSTNGSTWTTVFQNPSTVTSETAWSFQAYDISSLADNQPTVYIRWGMGPTNMSGNYCGWNIDDVTLSQTAGLSTGPRVTDPNISILGSGSGTGGVYKIGDTVTAQWNDTSGGDGNTGALAAANPVTVNFSQFGGPAAAAAADAGGFWTASYTIAAGAIESTNRNVSVTVTDLAGNTTTTADTTNLSVDNQPPAASMATVTPNPRTTAVGQIAIVFSEPVAGFDLADLELSCNGGANLLTASQTLQTSDNVTWLLGNLSGITGTGGTYVLTLPAAGSTVVDAAGNPLAADASESWLLNSTVAGRFIFYNDSAWDQGDPSPNANDDNAIAPDKQALLPGQTATFANYTSYSRGINGIMIDVSGLPVGTPTAADFEFRVGNDDTPTSWALLPTAATPTITVRRGAGAGGSDRITLIFPDGTAAGQWLRVDVLAGGDVGLADDDVFYFGNAIGEVGNSPTDAKVTVLDVSATRANQTTFLDPPSITNPYDFNRDEKVNTLDVSLARSSQTTFLNALSLISPPAESPAPLSADPTPLAGDSAPALSAAAVPLGSTLDTLPAGASTEEESTAACAAAPAAPLTAAAAATAATPLTTAAAVTPAAPAPATPAAATRMMDALAACVALSTAPALGASALSCLPLDWGFPTPEILSPSLPAPLAPWDLLALWK